MNSVVVDVVVATWFVVVVVTTWFVVVASVEVVAVVVISPPSYSGAPMLVTARSKKHEALGRETSIEIRG